MKGERALVARLRNWLAAPSPAASQGFSVPFGDDMATIATGADLLWSVDMLMEGVDFDSSRQGWREIGWKSLAVSLSDCAAMAAQPIAALCAVALSDRLDMQTAETLLAGIRDCGERYSCRLVGGDTNSWRQPTVISLTVAARAEPGCSPVLRSTARCGDRIYVSGPLGGSILGRHLRPTPRVELALALNRLGMARAMIDISDGLSLDLWRICEESACGAVLERDLLETVIHPDARALAQESGRPALEHALGDGEDFELIVMADARHHAALQGHGLLAIGEIVSDGGLWLRAGGERSALPPAGWEHFRAS